MRILFINHAFPGIFEDLAAGFGGNQENEVLFASSYGRQKYAMPGVRHMPLPRPESRAAKSGGGRELEKAMSIGRQTLDAFARLEKDGFVPDMVLASTGGGYCLFWEQAFPRSFRVSWTEGTFALSGGQTLGETDFVRHLLQCRQALGSDLFVSLTAGRKSPHSARLACGVDLPYAVNTEWFAPRAIERLLHGETDLAAVAELVVVIVGRERSHEDGILAAVLLLLAERPDCHVALLCGNGSALSSLKQKCGEAPQALRRRIHMIGMLSLHNYRNLLSLASMLVFPAGGNVPPSIMLEAMSCGTALLLPAESVVAPLMRHGENMFFARRDSPANVARNIASLLEDAPLLKKVRGNARETVLDNFDHRNIFPRQMNFLLDAYGAWKEKGCRASAKQP